MSDPYIKLLFWINRYIQIEYIIELKSITVLDLSYNNIGETCTNTTLQCQVMDFLINNITQLPFLKDFYIQQQKLCQEQHQD